jgi:HSP20 family protein
VRRRVSSGWELELIQRHLDELLDLLAVPREPAETGFAPAVDLQERDQSYVVKVDVPGVASPEIGITLRQRNLRITGRKLPGNDQASKGHCHHMERGFGPFSVEVLLPGPVRPDAAKATLRGGVLEISLPKVRERRDALYTIAVTDEET